MTYRVAVIGTGFMARKHCDALAARDDVTLSTICSTERSRAAGEELRDRYGFETSSTDFAAVLADDDLDLVVLCTPDQSHPEQAVAALTAGKHVLCEKALARSEEGFEHVRRALGQSGRVLQIGMNCRFREQYSGARRLAADGELGELRHLRGTYLVNVVDSVRQREKPWWLDHSVGDFGFLHGGGIHTLDLLRWIGGEIESVHARATGFELGDELGLDTFSVSLGFSDGATGELLVSGSALRPNEVALELWFGLGGIVGTRVFRAENARGPVAEEEMVVEQTTSDLALQFSDMIHAIEESSQPLNSFAEAYANFRVLDAVRRSTLSGQAVSVGEEG